MLRLKVIWRIVCGRSAGVLPNDNDKVSSVVVATNDHVAINQDVRVDDGRRGAVKTHWARCPLSADVPKDESTVNEGDSSYPCAFVFHSPSLRFALLLATISLLAPIWCQAAIPIIFIRAGTNAPAVVVPPGTNIVETEWFFVEAEDFDTLGQYFNSNPSFGHSFNATGLYTTTGATEDTDYHSGSSAANLYRAGTGVHFLVHDDGRPERTFDSDYAITNFASADPDWFRYKRSFGTDSFKAPPTNYLVYARIADHGSAAADVRLGLHDVTTGSTMLGGFVATTPGDGTFINVPLTHSETNATLSLTGALSFRVTASNDVSRFHRLTFVTYLPGGNTNSWRSGSTGGLWANPDTGEVWAVAQ